MSDKQGDTLGETSPVATLLLDFQGNKQTNTNKPSKEPQWIPVYCMMLSHAEIKDPVSQLGNGGSGVLGSVIVEREGADFFSVWLPLQIDVPESWAWLVGSQAPGSPLSFASPALSMVVYCEVCPGEVICLQTAFLLLSSAVCSGSSNFMVLNERGQQTSLNFFLVID